MRYADIADRSVARLRRQALAWAVVTTLATTVFVWTLAYQAALRERAVVTVAMEGYEEAYVLWYDVSRHGVTADRRSVARTNADLALDRLDALDTIRQRLDARIAFLSLGTARPAR